MHELIFKNINNHPHSNAKSLTSKGLLLLDSWIRVRLLSADWKYCRTREHWNAKCVKARYKKVDLSTLRFSNCLAGASFCSTLVHLQTNCKTAAAPIWILKATLWHQVKVFSESETISGLPVAVWPQSTNVAELTGDFYIRDLQIFPIGHSRSKVMTHFY